MLKTARLKTFRRGSAPGIVAMTLGVLLVASGADSDQQSPGTDPPRQGPAEPCVTGQPKDGPSIDAAKIPRFGANSPFGDNDRPLEVERERRLWADSWRWAKAPEFVVEQWLTDPPDTKGKYVLIEFWATWCGPCRRSIPLLNGFHKKFGKELVVIGVSEEPAEDVRKMKEPKLEFYSAVDTKKRMKDKLGVWGIPHLILLEPDGYVVWEGFPLQEGFELTDQIIERILEVGRKLRAGEK